MQTAVLVRCVVSLPRESLSCCTLSLIYWQVCAASAAADAATQPAGRSCAGIAAGTRRHHAGVDNICVTPRLHSASHSSSREQAAQVLFPLRLRLELVLPHAVVDRHYPRY